MIEKDSKEHQNILLQTMKNFTGNMMKQSMITEKEKENHIFYSETEYQTKKYKEESAEFTKQ
jgi:hypothetical protein